MINKLHLVVPAPEHKQAALDYKQEHIDYGENHIHGSGSFMQAEDYESWLKKITSAQTAGQTDWVNCSTYFGFVGDKIVGTIQIRHSLNDFLLKLGGHIGYGVRPSERRKGYASKMLEAALEICKELNIYKVLITCDKNNIASENTILKYGGVFENEATEDDGNIVKRYWISLEPNK